MKVDKEHTKSLKLIRAQEKRTVKDLNRIGKRLEWVREKLELSQRKVCEATDIPYSSYCGREAGIRAELVEEYLVLAQFYNKIWQKKYPQGKPWYDGQEVKDVSITWLLFGYDDVKANADLIIQEYEIKISELTSEFFNKEAELLNQLNMFTEKEVI